MGVGILAQTFPAAGSTDWIGWASGVDTSMRAWANASGIHVDEQSGSTFKDRLDQAIAEQQAATDRNMPPIVLPNGPNSDTVPRQMYSGLKLINAMGATGQKNPELSSGNFVGPEITLAGTIGNGTSSWWHNNAGSTLYNVYMAGFSVQGSQGSATHQFVDNASGNLYGFLNQIKTNVGGGMTLASGENVGIGSSAQLEIVGSVAVNRIIGGFDNDRIYGDAGNDLLMGGNLNYNNNPNLQAIVNDGQDELYGGSGNDNIVFEADAGKIDGDINSDGSNANAGSIGTSTGSHLAHGSLLRAGEDHVHCVSRRRLRSRRMRWAWR